MKSNKMVKENMENKNTFLVACVCSILLLLTMCYFGINTSMKGTSAVDTVSCGTDEIVVDGYCCPSEYSSVLLHDGVAYCTYTPRQNGGGTRLTYLDSITTSSGAYTWTFNSLVCFYPVPDCSATHTTAGYTCHSSFSETVTGVSSYVGINISEDISLCSAVANTGYACYYNSSIGYSWMLSTTAAGSGYSWIKQTDIADEAGCQAANDEFNEDKCYYCTLNNGISAYSWISEAEWQNSVLHGNCVVDYLSVKATNSNACSALNNKKYTVTINANGGELEVCNEGEIGVSCEDYAINLTSENFSVEDGETFDLGNEELFRVSRTNYELLGWAETSTATVPKYSTTDVLTISADTTLYAVWKADEIETPKTYTVTYNANGGSGAPNYQTKTEGIALALSNTKPTRTGYTFTGWNTEANGSGTSYSSGSNYTANANVTLYAQWNVNTYTVSYDANGGSGTMDSITCSYNSNCTLSANVFKKDNYVFRGWSTDSNVSYIDNATFKYTMTSDLKLYAVWTMIGEDTVNKYTVTYNANGGSGAPAAQTKTENVDLTLSSTKPTKTGYTFTGWNTKADGTGNAYAAGAKYTANANVTLYAQWLINSTPSKKQPTLLLEKDSVELDVGDSTTLSYTYDGDGRVSCTAGHTDIINCSLNSSNKTITIMSKSAGESVVILLAQPTDNYEGTEDQVDVLVIQKTSNNKTFTATFNANGGILDGKSTKTCTTDSTSCDIANLPTATKRGYTFTGWGTNASCESGETNKITVSANTTYYACYVIKDNTGTDSDENPTDNPQTGDTLIIMAWLVGLFAIGYSVYYFRKIKQN